MTIMGVDAAPKEGRKGQAITADFAVSLFIFSVAIVIVISMLTNILGDDDYARVRKEAVQASDVLMSEGYSPTTGQYWSGADVIRAGLLSDDRLSLRKAEELSNLTPTQLRQSLRLDDNVYISIQNASDGTVPLFGACGVGQLTVPNVPRNATLPTIAITNGDRPLTDAVMALPNLSDIAVQGADDGLLNLSPNDAVIIEGNITSNYSAAQTLLFLDGLSARGTRIVIVGDPGVPAFGLNLSYTTVKNITVQPAGAALGIRPADMTIVVNALEPVPVVNPSNETWDFQDLGRSDNASAENCTYATWRYLDSTVWYFSTLQGTAPDGTAAKDLLANATARIITVPRPICADTSAGATPPAGARQVSVQRRTILHHDSLLTLQVMVWK